MMKRSPLVRPPGKLPSAYQEVLAWNVTDNPRRVLLAQALAVLGFCLFGVVFALGAVSLGGQPLSRSFALGLREVTAIMVGTILTLVLHELTHGAAMQLYGAHPRYGILWKGMMLYTTASGYAYQRDQYIVIALAPFVCISALVVLAMWAFAGTVWVPLLALCGVINASGAVGDIWMTLIVLRYPPNAYIVDERDGIRVFCQRAQ
jgi:hypothetical protein